QGLEGQDGLFTSNTDMKTEKYGGHFDRDDLSSCSRIKCSDSSNNLIQKPRGKGSRGSSKTSAREGEKDGKESGKSSRKGSEKGSEVSVSKLERESPACACQMIEVELVQGVPSIKKEGGPSQECRRPSTKDGNEKIGMEVLTRETVTKRLYTYNLDVELPEGMRVSPRGKLVQDSGASAEAFGRQAAFYQRALPGYQEPYVACQQPPLVYAPEHMMAAEQYGALPIKSTESIVFRCVCNTGTESTKTTGTASSTKSSKATSGSEAKKSNSRNGTNGQEQPAGFVQVEFECRRCKHRKSYLVCKACNSRNKIRICKDCRSVTQASMGRQAGALAELAVYQEEYEINNQYGVVQPNFGPEYSPQHAYGLPQYALQQYGQQQQASNFVRGYPSNPVQTTLVVRCGSRMRVQGSSTDTKPLLPTCEQMRGYADAAPIGATIVVEIPARKSPSGEKKGNEVSNTQTTSSAKETKCETNERQSGRSTSTKSTRGSSLCKCGHDCKTCKVCEKASPSSGKESKC
ncbi:unnamed protein product, partial [Ixodes pacificus]